MPCLHKFAEDLKLERLNFKPTVLLIGTFNPGWDTLGNYAQWFYGRTNNNYFWDVLPRLYGHNTLRSASDKAWKAFCQHQQIALTDFIYRIDDADQDNPQHNQYLQSYRDDAITRYFHEFTTVDIPSLLNQHPSIRHVYLTRQANNGFWRQQWQPIVDYCQNNHLKAQTLLTPSGGARFQMPKNIPMTLRDFIFQRWQQHWHVQ